MVEGKKEPWWMRRCGVAAWMRLTSYTGPRLQVRNAYRVHIGTSNVLIESLMVCSVFSGSSLTLSCKSSGR